MAECDEVLIYNCRSQAASRCMSSAKTQLSSATRTLSIPFPHGWRSTNLSAIAQRRVQSTTERHCRWRNGAFVWWAPSRHSLRCSGTRPSWSRCAHESIFQQLPQQQQQQQHSRGQPHESPFTGSGIGTSFLTISWAEPRFSGNLHLLVCVKEIFTSLLLFSEIQNFKKTLTSALLICRVNWVNQGRLQFRRLQFFPENFHLQNPFLCLECAYLLHLRVHQNQSSRAVITTYLL